MKIIRNISTHFNTDVLVAEFDKQSDLYFEDPICSFLQPFVSVHRQRQIETIVSHLLVNRLNNKQEGIAYIKDDFGKPLLKGSQAFISISHTKQMVCAVKSQVPVGIDIQEETDKLLRIKEKFVSPQALKEMPLDQLKELLHITWGAKEAMYKAYGKKQLRFKTDLLIKPFEYSEIGGQTTGMLFKNDLKENYSIYYEKIDSNYLVYAIAANDQLQTNPKSDGTTTD